MPPKKSNLNNASTREARRKRVKRAHQLAEQIETGNTAQRIKTAEVHAQEQPDTRLQQNIPGIRAAQEQNIATVRVQEGQFQYIHSQSPPIAPLEVDVKPVVDHEMVADRRTSPLADPFQDAQGLNLAADFPNFQDIKSGLYNQRNRAHGSQSPPSIAPLEVDVKPVVDHEMADRRTSPLADPFQDAELKTHSPRIKQPRPVLRAQRHRGQKIVQYMNRLTQMEKRRITAEAVTAQALSDIAAALGRNAAAVQNISYSINKIANAILQVGIPGRQ